MPWSSCLLFPARDFPGYPLSRPINVPRALHVSIWLLKSNRPEPTSCPSHDPHSIFSVCHAFSSHPHNLNSDLHLASFFFFTPVFSTKSGKFSSWRHHFPLPNLVQLQIQDGWLISRIHLKSVCKMVKAIFQELGYTPSLSCFTDFQSQDNFQVISFHSPSLG